MTDHKDYDEDRPRPRRRVEFPTATTATRKTLLYVRIKSALTDMQALPDLTPDEAQDINEMIGMINLLMEEDR